MFFPAESDALSPLNTYVIPYKPPPAEVRKTMLEWLNAPAVTGMPVDYMLRSEYGIPMYLDPDLILK